MFRKKPCGHAASQRRSGRRQAASRKKTLKLTSQIAVLALAAAGIAGFSATHKTVTITVDGSSREVSTFAGSVAGVLNQEGVTYTEKDLVAPAPTAAVPRSGEIVVRSAHPLSVTIDGAAQTIWTTAPTVEEALADLGVRSEEADLSVSRNASVASLEGVVDVYTAKSVTVNVDGAALDAYTNAATVGQLLQEVGIVLGEGDQVVPALDQVPTPDQPVTIHRAIATSGTETSAIPFETVEKPDPTLTKGTKKVQTPGVAGSKSVAYTATVVNGKEVSRTVTLEAITAQPVTQVVLVGTKQVAVPPKVNINVDPSSAQGIARQMLSDSYGWGDDEFACLVSLWNRESGWRVSAENRSSGAYGIPQALPGSKMASAGSDWRTNPATQIKWGLGYIKGRYKTPCGAWGAFQSKGWY